MLWRIYFPGDFKNRINIHLPRMASVWYTAWIRQVTHLSQTHGWRILSKFPFVVTWEQRTPRLPKIPEPSWGNAVSWHKAILLRTILDHVETSQGFSVVSRKSTNDLILRSCWLYMESALWFQGRNWSMGKRNFPLNAGRVRVILCSEPLRKTRPESFLLSPPCPYLPSLLSMLALDPGLKPHGFPQLSSSWEMVQMNTPMPAQLFLIDRKSVV